MNAGKVTGIFRLFGLMLFFDRVKFIIQKIKNYHVNRDFIFKNPNVNLPPDYTMFEAFQLNYDKYYNDGKNTANFIKTEIEQFIQLNSVNILDWGCGPARIIRHLPAVINNNCRFYGTDYNSKTIEWCLENIKEIDFRLNYLEPPLEFASDFFSIVYGISVFTHLSEDKHFLWFDELIRVSKPGAVILLTTQGEIFKTKMTDKEVLKFERGALITRADVMEGHRIYAAFQPQSFMHKMIGDRCAVLKHKPGKKESWGLSQDLWIVRKK